LYAETYLIELYGCTNVWLRALGTYAPGTTNALYAVNTSELQILQSLFSGSGGDGVELSGCDEVLITNTIFEDNGAWGLDIINCEQITVTGYITDNNTSGGIRLSSTASTGVFIGAGSSSEATPFSPSVVPTRARELAHIGRWLGAAEWSIQGGTPTLTYEDDTSVYNMNDSTMSVVVSSWVNEFMGGDGLSINMYVYYAMATATSGNVVLSAVLGRTADGSVLQDWSGGGSTTVAVPGVARTLKIVRIPFTMSSIGRDDLISVHFKRDGGNAADTATGDLHFFGAFLTNCLYYY